MVYDAVIELFKRQIEALAHHSDNFAMEVSLQRLVTNTEHFPPKYSIPTKASTKQELEQEALQTLHLSFVEKFRSQANSIAFTQPSFLACKHSPVAGFCMMRDQLSTQCSTHPFGF